MYIQDQTIKKLKNHRTLEEETAKPPHAHLGKKKKKKVSESWPNKMGFKVGLTDWMSSI